MKKIFAMVMAILLAVSFTACAEAETLTEVSREIIDTRYTEAYNGVETEYEYKYDWWKGDFVLVPVMKTVHYNEKYEIQYRITYDNGSEETKWCVCTEAEYKQAVAELGGADNG